MGQGEKNTRGKRVRRIRSDLGDGTYPLPMEQFVTLIRETTGAVYDTSMMSRMETGKRKVSIEDVEAIAPVDPLQRGKMWLAGWDDEAGGQNAQTTKGPTSSSPDPELQRTPWREHPREILPPIQRGGGTKKRRPKDDRSAIAS